MTSWILENFDSRMGDNPVQHGNTVSSQNSLQSAVNTVLDPLYIAPHDNPDMALTSVQFNGLNFVGWSRQIKRGLTGMFLDYQLYEI